MEVEATDEHFGVVYIDPNELRPCAECQACCSIMAVPDLDKPSFTRCQFQCATGCSIYGKHPDTCQSFMCLWKLPGFLLTDDDRPDKLGVIFCVRSTGNGKQLEVWELFPGAARQPRVREILSKISVDYLIVAQLNWSIQV